MEHRGAIIDKTFKIMFLLLTCSEILQCKGSTFSRWNGICIRICYV